MRFGPNQPDPPTLTLPTGVLDAALGRSYAQIAAEGRSQHKTQEMGGALLHGPQSTGLRLVESVVPRVEKEQSVFDGIDTSIPGLAALAGLPAGSLAAPLATMDAAAREALDSVDVRAPARVLPILARGLKAARDARTAVAALAAPADARADATFLLDQEIPAVRGGHAARLGRARRGAGDHRDHRARRTGERQRARLRARGA